MGGLTEQIFGVSTGFIRYSAEHIIPIAIFIVATMFWIARMRTKPEKQRHRSAFYFSLVLAVSIVISTLIKLMRGEFTWKEDLPFHLCNILALLFPFALKYNRRWFYGVLYFWVIVGTFQAILTPDLKERFPHFIFFRYWLVHCGLVSIVLYGIVCLSWKIRAKDIVNAILGANVYMVFSFIVNYFSGGNYFFTMHKPESASLLDHIGPWPWYLLSGQLVMFVLFCLAYVPILIYKMRQKEVSQLGF